jgi:hypothetical protein
MYSVMSTTGSNLLLDSTASGDLALVNLLKTRPILGIVTPLITRGLTVQQRIGDYINITKIDLRMRTFYGSLITGDVIIRWMLVKQKTVSGTLLSPSGFCSDYFGQTQIFTNALPNWNNRDVSARYSILKKGSVYMRSSVTGATEIRDWGVFYIPKKPIRTSYTLGNGGTISDIDSNMIYLLMYTDNANNGLLTSCEGNVYYHDA